MAAIRLGLTFCSKGGGGRFRLLGFFLGEFYSARSGLVCGLWLVWLLRICEKRRVTVQLLCLF